jgi:hypothetical protein
MKFHIELHRFGFVFDRFTVSARKAQCAGVWYGDWPYLPSDEQVLKGLPYQYRRAFERCGPIWWSKRDGLSNVVRCDLYRKKDGAPLGSIFACFDASPLIKGSAL